MSRFILLNESGETDEAVGLIEGMDDVRIVDRTGDRALLVETSPERAEELASRLAGWKVRPETGHPKPAPPFPRGRWKL